jgi:hypothetical protein
MPIKVEVDALQQKVFVWQDLISRETRNYNRELKSAKFWYDISMKKWFISITNWEEVSVKCMGKYLPPNPATIEAVICRFSDNNARIIYPG